LAATSTLSVEASMKAKRYTEEQIIGALQEVDHGRRSTRSVGGWA
jgi:hypothetical protein